MVDRCGTLITAYKKIILENFGTFENFKNEGIKSWLWIQDNLDQLTSEQLHELIADCEVQRLIPSYMSKKHWENLHSLSKLELSRRT